LGDAGNTAGAILGDASDTTSAVLRDASGATGVVLGDAINTACAFRRATGVSNNLKAHMQQVGSEPLAQAVAFYEQTASCHSNAALRLHSE
jgi:hypothetical protein